MQLEVALCLGWVARFGVVKELRVLQPVVQNDLLGFLVFQGFDRRLLVVLRFIGVRFEDVMKVREATDECACELPGELRSGARRVVVLRDFVEEVWH